MKENILLYKDEEIKPIVGYEDLYSITSFGRVWSHARIRSNCKFFEGRFLKPSLDKGKKGYLQVLLYKESKSKTFKVHILVAQAYILNPQNLPQVNHKDGNKLNCRKDNLEWCTHDYNINHSIVNGFRCRKHSKFFGVTFLKNVKKKPWVFRLQYKNIKYSIGSFKTEIEAAIAYNNFVIKNNINRPLNNIDEILKSQVK